MTRERGPAWDGDRTMNEQEGWPEHAAFLNELVSAKVIAVGGPLGDGGRILLIIEASSEAKAQAELEADPWTSMQLLTVVSVEPWTIMLGELTRP